MLTPGEEVRWLAVWERVTEAISRWAIGVVVIAVIAGTTQGTTAWLLGSSYALGLGVIAGLLDMIPNIGATIAGFILVPTLWAEEGVTAAIIMLVVVLAYQQVENNIITPKVQGKAVQLSAFFIIVAVTLFGALLGVLGALTAVPIAATIQIFVQELTKERRERTHARRRRDPADGWRGGGRRRRAARRRLRRPPHARCEQGLVRSTRRRGAARAAVRGGDRGRGPGPARRPCPMGDPLAARQ
jgi:predicted PurR-regulated permease PerM